MKRKTALFLSLVVCLAFFALYASAEGGYKISSDGNCEDGTLTVTFSLTDITTDVGLSGVCFAVSYDTSYLEAISVKQSLPEKWKNAEELANIITNEGSGRIVLGAAADECEPLKENGYSVTVTFNVLKDGETKLTVDAADEVFCGVVIADGKPVEVKGEGCEFTCVLGNAENETSAAVSDTPKGEDGGSSAWLYVGIGAAVAVIAIVCVIVIKKKKR